MSRALVRLEGISKRFGSLLALEGVGLAIEAGEIHAVVGSNGAGKSTLMKILAGAQRPDAGAIHLRGRPVVFRSPADARHQGVAIVHQEPSLFPHLSVAANIFMMRERTGRGGLLAERTMAEASRRVLESLLGEGKQAALGPAGRRGLGAHIDVREKAARLSAGERQVVEIARALEQRSEVLILDEPNSALSGAESERLFDLLRKLRDRGIAVIYVSHRLDEVFALADRITVLRDGRTEGTWRTADTTMAEVVAALAGRPVAERPPPASAPAAGGPPVLEVRGLRGARGLGPLSFHARAGEIVGFAGIEGSGVGRLFRILFGLETAAGGEVVYEGRVLAGEGPEAAIRRGWALIPANRREEGLIMDFSLEKNLTLPILDRHRGALGLIDAAKERATAEAYVARLSIASDHLDKPVARLSGGNQQKVVFAKWLATWPRLLLLDDPTRAVDVHARAEIAELCRGLARGGAVLLMISSDVQEMLDLCDRVLVVRHGLVVRELGRGEGTKPEVMRLMSGGAPAEAPRTRVSALGAR